MKGRNVDTLAIAQRLPGKLTVPLQGSKLRVASQREGIARKVYRK